MTFTAETQTELTKPLNPALTKSLKGMRYLEGHTAISQANRIFGFDGWGYDVVDLQLHEIDTKDKQGNPKKAYGYSATVRVEVQGAGARTDVGFNTVAEWKSGYHPDAHDTAMKGAVTDAMKRALRSFGHQFGNGLYGDGTYEQKVESGQQAPPPQNGNGKVQGGDSGWMGDDAPQKADGKLLTEIQRMGAEVYGQGEWVNGVAGQSAAWASGDRVDAVDKLTQVEALKLSKGLRKRLEGAE